MKEIENVLSDIGLTKGEVEVYLGLLKIGLSSAGRITKEANIGSSKVYEVLQRLCMKGLVNYVVENNVKLYNATPSKNLIYFVEQKKSVLEKNIESLNKIMPLLNKDAETTQAESLIYRGKQGPIILLKELIEIGSEGYEILGFGTDKDDWKEYYPAQLKEFIKESKNKNIKSRLIFQKGYVSINDSAKIKYLPKSLSSPVRTIVAGEKVFIVDFTKPITTIVLNKKEIAKAYVAYFEALWDQADF